MIVVLGSEALGAAVSGTHPGELVVGATDDVRLGGPIDEAAEIAAVLPIPARACVVAASDHPADAVEAVRRAGGSLIKTPVVFMGDPPNGEPPSAWRATVARLGASACADSTELAVILSTDGDAPATSAAEQRALRPGAPEAAAWRDALRTARPRRRLLARRPRPMDRRTDAELDAGTRRPLAEGCHSIAVISPKGGVGKTTLTFLLGSVLARVRHERVIAIDTNPDFGTLADLVGERVPSTISDLLRDLRYVRTGDDVEAYVTVARSGMHILAAPQDPLEMTRLGSGGYRAVSELIRQFYDMVVFDCGTGFLDDITQFALSSAGQVVLVTQAQLVSAKIVVAALERLADTGFDPGRVTVAVNMVRGDDTLDVRRLAELLGARVGAVVEIPWDRTMQREVDLGDFSYARMRAATRTAVRRLAATVVAGLPAREHLVLGELADDGEIPGGMSLPAGGDELEDRAQPPSGEKTAGDEPGGTDAGAPETAASTSVARGA